MNGISPPNFLSSFPCKREFKLLAAFAVFLSLFQPGLTAEATPKNTIRSFIEAVNGAHWRQAYGFLSKPLQGEVTYGDFHDAARRVKSMTLVSIVMLKQTPEVAKARVTVDSLEKEEGARWKKHRRAGELVFIPEKGEWRVIQVNFLNLNKHKKGSGKA